uniref:Uncharacterized protein n=1 Tax=Zea mays TaxID=4577 RepID=A0A804PCL5_MAIZE
MAEHIFKNKFEVSKLDPDGDEVNRIEAHSVNEISWLLVLLGAQHDGIPFMLLGRKTLVDDYEYIMLGKLFKVSKDSTKDGNGNSSTKVLFMYGHTKAKGRHNTAVKVVSPSQKQPLCI